MAIVKVWNDNIHPYKEMFKGDPIAIGAGEYIEMDWEDAVQFKGQFGHGIAPVGPNGKPDARFFKMIRVESPGSPVIVDDGLTCHANGKKAASKEELAALLSEFAHMHVKDEEAEKAQGDEVSRLKSDLEMLRGQINVLMSEKSSEKEQLDGRRKNRA